MNSLPSTSAPQQRNSFVLGLSFGVLAVLAAERLYADAEGSQASTSQIIHAYKNGVDDALKTNPVSWRLEETCLEVWANKQSVQ